MAPLFSDLFYRKCYLGLGSLVTLESPWQAKRFAPRTSTGILFFAAHFLDLIWPVFLLPGVEHVRIAPAIMKRSTFDFYD